MAKVTFEISDETLNQMFGTLESLRQQMKPEVTTAVQTEALGLVLEHYAQMNPHVFLSLMQNSIELFKSDLYQPRERRLKSWNR